MVLVVVGTRTDANSLRSQVGIGSESDCLLGRLESCLYPSPKLLSEGSLLLLCWLSNTSTQLRIVHFSETVKILATGVLHLFTCSLSLYCGKHAIYV